MVTNDTGLLQSIFMFGGAPRRMFNSVVQYCSEKNNHRDTEHTEVAQRRSRTETFVQSLFSEVELNPLEVVDFPTWGAQCYAETLTQIAIISSKYLPLQWHVLCAFRGGNC